MTKEELKKEAEEYVGSKSCDTDDYSCGFLPSTVEEMLIEFAEPREKYIAELEAEIEKLIDFVLSKTECCDVCPITDTCTNGEGTCHYAGILAKGEEEVIKEWLMQFISRR